MTALLDLSTGTIAATYYYDAFGNILDSTGSFSNPIRYAGYTYDTETDLYYLNVRYYDSKIARFLSEDTYRGSSSDPLSLNLYTYCSNNPIKYTDPTGHWQQGDENLTYESRIEISRLTDLYYAAKTQAEKDAIHAAADAIRNNSANIAATPQNSVTGAKVNEILKSQSYMTQQQWQAISSTKNDSIVRQIIGNGITRAEINAVAVNKPTNAVSSNSSINSMSVYPYGDYRNLNFNAYTYSNAQSASNFYAQLNQPYLSAELLYMFDPEFKRMVDSDISTNWEMEGILYGFKQQALDIANMFIDQYNKGVHDSRYKISLLQADHKEPLILADSKKVFNQGALKGRILFEGTAFYATLAGGEVVSAIKASKAIEGAAKTPVIGKMKDLSEIGANEYRVADLLPDMGSPQANWKQNSGVLRSIMNQGNPIKDASPLPLPANVNPGFLGAERNLLTNHGWTYRNGFWYPLIGGAK